MVFKKTHQNQQGVVALLTSIIVGLLLIIITSGAIAVSTGELRQATDYDNSIKAYYAAESGAEDAIAAIRRGLNDGQSLNSLAKNTCTPYNLPPYAVSSYANLSADGNVKYTCQIVNVQQNQLNGTLSAEESAQIDLSSTAGFTQLRLKWNQRGTSDPQGYAKNSIPISFPIGSAWSGIYPSVMETTVISYPNAASFNSCNVRTITAVLKPANTSNNTLSIPSLNANDCATPNTAVATPVLTDCNPSGATGSYDCTMTISGFNPLNNRYVIRLNSRYSSAHYQLEALSAGGINQIIPNAQLVIDVTGRSGDISRRVLLQAPLNGQSPLNYVLLANDSICKVLTVSNVTNQATPENGCQ